MTQNYVGCFLKDMTFIMFNKKNRLFDVKLEIVKIRAYH